MHQNIKHWKLTVSHFWRCRSTICMTAFCTSASRHSVLLPVWGENTGGNRFHTKAIESTECVRGRPARSPTITCQRGTMSQRPGGRHTFYRVSSQPERAMHTLCLISQCDGIHYPVGHPLLGDGIHFLPAAVTDKSWSEVLRLRVLST